MVAVSKVPVLAVSVAVWSQECVLLVQRGNSPNKGLWALPGGKVEFGESLAEAAQRELLEETGLLAKPQNLFRIRDIKSPEFHYSLHSVTAILEGGTLKASDDAADARWVTLNEIDQLPTVPDLLRSIELSKSGPFFPI